MKVRDLYGSLGEPGKWASYIARLREQNRHLTAFKDELEKAGL